MKRLWPVLLLLAVGCDPDRRPVAWPTPVIPTPTPAIGQPTPGGTPIILGGSPFYVQGGQEIWMKAEGAAGKPRRVFRADDHEGLGELIVSPDRHWIVSHVAFPYDVPESSEFRTYPILIHVDSSTRVDMQELPTRFGLTGTPTELAWVPGKLATLKVTMTDGSNQVVDAPPTG